MTPRGSGAWDEGADDADWRHLWAACGRLRAPRAPLARCVASGVDAACVGAALEGCGTAREELLEAAKGLGWAVWPRGVEECPGGSLNGIGDDARRALERACGEAREFDQRAGV